MKLPLGPEGIERLAAEALRREFDAAAERAGHGWVKEFVYPDWLMRKFIEEHPE